MSRRLEVKAGTRAFPVVRGIALLGGVTAMSASCGGTSNVRADGDSSAGGQASEGEAGKPGDVSAGRAGGAGVGGGGGGATGVGGGGATGVGGGAGIGGELGGEAGVPAHTGGATGDGSAGTTADPVGAVGSIGEPCSPRGALACAGNRQKVVVVCGASDTWEIHESCGAGEYCDSTEGSDAGVCKQGAPACEDLPGDSLYCDEMEVRRCSVDGLSTFIETCEFDCVDGACSDACLDNVLMNCSEECGGPVACAEACGPGLEGMARVTLLAPPDTLVPGVSYLIRLPIVEESDSCAESGCWNLGKEGGDAKKGIAVLFPTNSDAPLFRVTVEAPWALGLPPSLDEGDYVCNGPSMTADETTCITRHAPGSSEAGIWIVTAEATARSALLTVEVGDETLPDCP